MPATPAQRQRRYNFYLNFIIYAKTNFPLFIDLCIFYSVVDEENIDNTICTQKLCVNLLPFFLNKNQTNQLQPRLFKFAIVELVAKIFAVCVLYFDALDPIMLMNFIMSMVPQISYVEELHYVNVILDLIMLMNSMMLMVHILDLIILMNSMIWYLRSYHVDELHDVNCTLDLIMLITP